jgi:hypothetical protein
VHGLHRGDDVQLRQPVDVIGVHDLDMLDAMPVGMRGLATGGFFGANGLEHIQHLTHSPITDGMN